MPYYIIASTIAHQFTVATDLETLSAARNSAKILLDLPGSIIQSLTIKSTDSMDMEIIDRDISPNGEAEGGLK
jgi:hypothetical protein